MKFLCVVAHLLHPLKARIAFIADVQLLLVRDLLMLHELLHLAELPPARVAEMFFKQEPVLASPVPVVPALLAQVTFNLPGRLWVVKEHPQLAIARRAEIDLPGIVGILLLVTCLTDKEA